MSVGHQRPRQLLVFIQLADVAYEDPPTLLSVTSSSSLESQGNLIGCLHTSIQWHVQPVKVNHWLGLEEENCQTLWVRGGN